MAIFKIVNRPYKNPDAVQKTIRYILGCGMQGKVLFTGGYGVDGTDYGRAVEQFLITKRIYRKENKRQVLHMVVSFDNFCEKKLQTEDLKELAAKIGALLSKGAYQVIWACHVNTENRHIHFIINSVSYLTGMKYRLEPGEVFGLRYNIEVMIAPKIYTPQRIMEMCDGFCFRPALG